MTRDEQPTDDDAPWHKLDKRTFKVTAVLLIGGAVASGVPAAIGLASWLTLSVALALVLPGAVFLIGGGMLADYLVWRKTWYRVLPDAVELWKGILFVSRRRLARDRIRSVDLSAHPVMRVFGLVKLTLGTGEQGGGSSSTQTIVLDPIPQHVGEQLRTELLDRRHSEDPHVERLATWKPFWTCYAPLSVATVLFAGAVVGVAFQVSDWFGRGSLPVEIVRDRIAAHGVVTVLLVGVAVLTAAGVLLSIAFYLELWWRYRLDREAGGTLRVTRGLLTSRSVTLEEERIRGVDLVEPLGVRLAGAARVQVIATGLSAEAEQKSQISTLLPAAPRSLAHTTAEEIIGEAPTVRLTAHPPAALTRRLRWALMIIVGSLLCWATAATLTGWATAWNVAAGLVLAVLAAALLLRARDSARNLGHALTRQHLFTRWGSIRRSTVLLRREGVIGWRVRQSIFQRRAGLATLIAITAGGKGRYPVLDGDADQIIDLADAAAPDVLDQFREPTG